MHEFLTALYDDHRLITQLLNVFERELNEFEQARHSDYEVLESGLEYCSEYLDAVHHRKEEQMLQQLQKLDPGVASRAVDLTPQHQQLEQLTHRVATAFAQVRDDAYAVREHLVIPAREWLMAYRDHIAWEEKELFEPAAAVLAESDWDKAAKNWEDAVNPLHNPAREHRFFELSEAIRTVSKY